MSTAKRNQEIRTEVLRDLYAAGQQIGVSCHLMHRRLKTTGFDFTSDEVLSALLFLAGQGFVECVQDPATGVARYVITSKGVLHYEASNG